MSLTDIQAQIVATRSEYEQSHPLAAVLCELQISTANLTKMSTSALFAHSRITHDMALEALAPIARALVLACEAWGIGIEDVLAKNVEEV